jgi:cytochrome P460
MNAGEKMPPDPRFTREGELIRPVDYREWIYLTSGLGMSYDSTATHETDPTFDNVFVNPAAYRAFLETGKWPDKTVFVLEVRSSASRGSINKAGHFQSGLVSVEASVKDSRFPEKWAYFSFGGPGSMRASARAFPKEECHSCHSQHGAVENTFVQFYPTLLEVAKAKGTLKAAYSGSPEKSSK